MSYQPVVGPSKEGLLAILLSEHAVRLLDMVGEAVECDGLEAELALDKAGVVRVVRVGAPLHHLGRNTLLRIRDVYPESRIRLFSIPDPGSEFWFPSRIRFKELKNVNPKKWFLSSGKYDPGCLSRIPDPDPDFLPIPDPGSRGQKGTGYRIRIRNTAEI
jgi:hypothetical protein